MVLSNLFGDTTSFKTQVLSRIQFIKSQATYANVVAVDVVCFLKLDQLGTRLSVSLDPLTPILWLFYQISLSLSLIILDILFI